MRTCAVLCLLLVVAGCGDRPSEDAGAPRASTGTVTPDGLDLPAVKVPDAYSIDDPPQFHVLTDDGQLDLRPWTICYTGGCADGGPSDDPPQIGSPNALVFGFDVPGWTFDSISFREHGTRQSCGRTITVAAETTGERTFRALPAGPAGDWDVDIFGRGPGGDAVTTVRWQTPTDGAYPTAASGTASVLADDDGELDSYGVELSVSDLDRRYDRATATIRVTSSTGDSVVLEPRAVDPCYDEGSLFFRASDSVGRRATALGAGPYDYEVRLVLGGTTYVGRATWPDDTNEEITPGVPLQWEPALPVYAG
jgi:hypothetical protein